MDVQLDPIAVERAEKSIDEFINSRSRAKERANELEAMWAESELVRPRPEPVWIVGRKKLNDGGVGGHA